MKKNTVSLLAGMTALVFTAGALNAQTTVWQFTENFEDAPLGFKATAGSGSNLLAGWDSAYTQSNYPANSVQIVQGGVFPGSTQHLQARNAAAFGIGKHVGFDAQIVSVSFDLVTYANSPVVTSRPLNVQFYGDGSAGGTTLVDNANRAHATSINTVNNSLNVANTTFGAHGNLVRFEMVMNNSLQDYSHTVGTDVYLIPSGQAGVWANGTHLLTHNSARAAVNSVPTVTVGQNIGAIAFLIDNNATSRGSFDLDNIVVQAIPEPSTYALIFGALVLAGAFLRRRR